MFTIIKNADGHGTNCFCIVPENGTVPIAQANNLMLAGFVLRYLNGAPMHKKDAEAARAAMQAFDNRKED